MSRVVYTGSRSNFPRFAGLQVPLRRPREAELLHDPAVHSVRDALQARRLHEVLQGTQHELGQQRTDSYVIACHVLQRNTVRVAGSQRVATAHQDVRTLQSLLFDLQQRVTDCISNRLDAWADCGEPRVTRDVLRLLAGGLGTAAFRLMVTRYGWQLRRHALMAMLALPHCAPRGAGGPASGRGHASHRRARRGCSGPGCRRRPWRAACRRAGPRPPRAPPPRQRYSSGANSYCMTKAAFVDARHRRRAGWRPAVSRRFTPSDPELPPVM